MQYFLGIDVSTTASKAIIIDETGAVVATHSVLHAPFSVPGKPLWSEQDPEMWWVATSTAIKGALDSVSSSVTPSEIKCVGLTGQMQGLVVLDKDFKPLRPAILWNDQRSSEECDEIEKQLGRDFLCQHIGSKILPCHLAPKLEWIKKNEPLYAKIAHVITPKDYVRFRLSGADEKTGKLIVDASDSGGFAMTDVSKREWSPTIIQKLNIPENWLPMIRESTSLCGQVSIVGAQSTGLVAGTPIAAGAGDQPAQSIGCGMVTAGAMSLQIGTSGVISQIGNYAPAPDGGYLNYCHGAENEWIKMGLTAAAAGSFRWFRDNIAKNYSFQQLDQMASEIPPGADGLLFIPDICGNIHPYGNALARGSFVGLTERHTLGHMARAVLEGVAFSMKEIVDVMCSKSKFTPESFVFSGGAANSQLWTQIFADIMQKPLRTLKTNEGAAYGAAIIAGVAVGCWADLESACNQLIKENETIKPNEEATEIYQEKYQIWRDVYPQLDAINLRLASPSNTNKKINPVTNKTPIQTLFHQYGKLALGAAALASAAGLIYLKRK